jgi:hypothetical protein
MDAEKLAMSNRGKINALIALSDSIPGATSTPSFNTDGTLHTMTYTDTITTDAVRTDTFVYDTNLITETRVPASGSTVTITYHLDTLVTVVS